MSVLHNFNIKRLVPSVLLCTILSACGGGAGGSSNPSGFTSTNTNNSPISSQLGTMTSSSVAIAKGDSATSSISSTASSSPVASSSAPSSIGLSTSASNPMKSSSSFNVSSATTRQTSSSRTSTSLNSSSALPVSSATSSTSSSKRSAFSSSASNNSSSISRSSSKSSSSSSYSSSIFSSSKSSNLSSASSIQITAPTNVQVNAGVQTASMTWNTVNGASSYNLYYSTDSNFTINNVAAFAHGTKISNAVSPLNINNLTGGLTYYFVVTAVQSGNESGASTKVFATPTAATSGNPTTLSFLDFENNSLIQNGWTIGAQQGGSVVISTDKTQNHGGSNGSLKATYPFATAGMYAWAEFNLVPYNTRDVYIEFDVKIPPDANGRTPGSAKFLKFFGQNTYGYANTTFGISGDAGQVGSLTYIGFGDGNGNNIENDVGNVILLTGEYPNWIGRSYGAATVYNKGTNWNYWDWKNQWHHFRVHAKFHTSNFNYSTNTCVSETNDGEYYLEIDGVTFVDAKGLFNHHCGNFPFSRVNLLDWGGGTFGPFEINLDNIRITSGGFL